MKNYTYGWRIEELGYKEVDKSKYTEEQIDMCKFIESMSYVIRSAKCGWSSVEYKAMKHENGSFNEYMVLCVDGHGERYIPISGNSKGCNLSVLGENLW